MNRASTPTHATEAELRDLNERAARLRAGRYYGARPDIFAQAYSVNIGATPDGEGEVRMQGHSGDTESARKHFAVTAEPQVWTAAGRTFRSWTHHIGRDGHGVVLEFVEAAS